VNETRITFLGFFFVVFFCAFSCFNDFIHKKVIDYIDDQIIVHFFSSFVSPNNLI